MTCASLATTTRAFALASGDRNFPFVNLSSKSKVCIKTPAHPWIKPCSERQVVLAKSASQNWTSSELPKVSVIERLKAISHCPFLQKSAKFCPTELRPRSYHATTWQHIWYIWKRTKNGLRGRIVRLKSLLCGLREQFALLNLLREVSCDDRGVVGEYIFEMTSVVAHGAFWLSETYCSYDS